MPIFNKCLLIMTFSDAFLAQAQASQEMTIARSGSENTTQMPVKTHLTGQVVSNRHSQIAFRQTGFIEKISVKMGSTVKKGDVLALLDDRDFKLKLELANARKALARVNLDAMGKELKREEQLSSENASTQTSYDKVKAAYDQARINFKLAEIDVKTQEKALEETKLLSPFDGIIFQQLKDQGENVQPGNPVFEVFDLVDPELNFEVPERLISSLKIGSKLQVTIPAKQTSAVAEITRLVPVVSDRNRTFKVVAKFKDPVNVTVGVFAEATLME